METCDGRFPHVPAGGGAAYAIGGETITFKVTTAQSEGAFLAMDLMSLPGGGPPLHTHPSTETFVILEGAFEFSGVDRGEPYAITAVAGDTIHVPGGAPHTFTCVGRTPGRALGILAPGGEMERFFAEAGTPVGNGAEPAAPAGPPSEAAVARFVEIAGRHGIVFLPPQGSTVGAAG